MVMKDYMDCGGSGSSINGVMRFVDAPCCARRTLEWEMPIDEAQLEALREGA